MSSYAVLFVLLVSVLVSSVQSYRFLRDRYLMRGCPIVDCSQEEEIPSICRFPTLYNHNGKMCRGCYSDWCKGYFWQPPAVSKDTKDAKDSKDIKDSNDTNDSKDTKEIKNTKEVHDTKTTNDTKEANNINDPKDSKYADDPRETNGLKESKNLENSKTSKDC